jgi:hypothetical protein
MNQLAKASAERTNFVEGTWLQHSWDSTSLGELKTCPRKYEYTIIRGLRPRGESVHLRFGIVFHSALETYDKVLALGADEEAALDEALAHALEKTWDRTEEYTGPWISDHSAKNRENLIRSVLWYLFHYSPDPANTIILSNGKPAVELSFKMESGYKSLDGIDFILSGHLDRMVTYADDTFVMDRKTTGSGLTPYYFSQFNPDNQMSLYSLAGRIIFETAVSGVIIDAAKVMVGFTEFGRGITTRTKGQLDEFLENTYYWFDLAQRFAEQNFWPMNEKSCGNYGGCAFRGVCSKDPEVREMFIRSDFEVHFWNPLESR